MIDYQRALELVFRAIDDVREADPSQTPLEKSEDTTLFGDGSALDSIGLVNLIVSVEGHIENELGATITIADERAMSQVHSPFRSVGSLAAYIASRLDDSKA